MSIYSLWGLYIEETNALAQPGIAHKDSVPIIHQQTSTSQVRQAGLQGILGGAPGQMRDSRTGPVSCPPLYQT